MAALFKSPYSRDQDDTSEEKLSISSLTHQCRQSLRSLARHLRNSTSWQQDLSTIDDSQRPLESHTSYTSDSSWWQQHHLAVENLQGRLWVWANNIGALRDPRSMSSLDCRLRDGGQMRKSVMQALIDIRESAESATPILTGALPNRTDAPHGAFENPGQDGDLSVTTELDELLSGIGASVDRLFRLSMLIRRDRPRGRLPAETTNQVNDPSMDIRHVKDKYPKVREAEWLAERLGTAIAKRRAFIYYRQLHHHRLKEQNQDLKEEGSAELGEAPSTIATTYYEHSLDAEQQSVNPASLSVVTEATSFATAFGSDENGDLRVPDLTRLKFHGTQLEYGSHFECPFCRTIQVVSSEYEWRRHVFTDLQPYVCTFESCTSDLFPTRHEWFSHELESHRKQWHCTKCLNSKFTSASSLREHFNSTHQGSFTDHQWPLILKLCNRSPRKFESSSCPLCFSWDPPENKPDNSEEFCRHLGSHLQQLALTALPIAIEGLVILEDEDHGIIPGAGEAVGPNMSAAPSVRDIQRIHVKLANFFEKDKYLVHVLYKDGNKRKLKREYQDFRDLQAKLLERFPDELNNFAQNRPNLPILPGPINHVTLIVAERQVSSIYKYLKDLLDLPTHMSRSDPVLEFFKPREGD